MLWDVFCRVIDNFGDIGVCWRLARGLGERGHAVRLWVDDTSALAWMAPQLQWPPAPAATHSEDTTAAWHGLTGLRLGHAAPDITVLPWNEAQQHIEAHGGWQPGEVVIEAFGCDPPEAFVRAMQRPAPPVWINLEYLSAEPYVERCHGLPSPVGSGPGRGLVKRFFYPGFTPATGGLLREASPETAPGQSARARALGLLQALGVSVPEHAALVSLFCYSQAPVADLLDRLTAPLTPPPADARPVHLLLTPGPATALAQTWAAARAPSDSHTRALCLHPLPHLPQEAFDQLLGGCDLNLVRGEDSAVRALWAGAPHLWQIYAQDDGVHAHKLEAFMARWMADWPAELRAQTHAWWRAWNRLGPMPPQLPDWSDPQGAWATASRASRAKLSTQADLVTQLIQFVTTSG